MFKAGRAGAAAANAALLHLTCSCSDSNQLLIDRVSTGEEADYLHLKGHAEDFLVIRHFDRRDHVFVCVCFVLCRCDGGDGLQPGGDPGLSGQDEV